MLWKLVPTTELEGTGLLQCSSCEKIMLPECEAYLATGEHPRTGQLRLTLHVRLAPGRESERETLHGLLRTATVGWLKAESLT